MVCADEQLHRRHRGENHDLHHGEHRVEGPDREGDCLERHAKRDQRRARRRDNPYDLE